MLAEILLAVVCALLYVLLILHVRRSVIKHLKRLYSVEKMLDAGYSSSNEELISWLRQEYFMAEALRGTAIDVIEMPEPRAEELEHIYKRMKKNRTELYREAGTEMNFVYAQSILALPPLIGLIYCLARIIQYSILPHVDYVYVTSDGLLGFLASCIALPLWLLSVEVFIGPSLYKSNLGSNWKRYYSAANCTDKKIIYPFTAVLTLIAAAGLYYTIDNITSYTALGEEGIILKDKTIPWSDIKAIYSVTEIYKPNEAYKDYEIEMTDGAKITISESQKAIRYSASQGAAYASKKANKTIKCIINNKYEGKTIEC